ncbi:MAG: hypothetical protein PHT67_03035 [Candidatus Pacebacteria bacterium]|nr:hypothetical protein [Candidatus Paceibacterota bacterium]MDD5665483.1 hypothetical protein [Candidatus Omnitrophota bacterium]
MKLYPAGTVITFRISWRQQGRNIYLLIDRIFNGVLVMTDSIKSLLIFIIILAITGAAVGGAYYVAVELPQQKAIEENPPANPTEIDVQCNVCKSNCKYETNYNGCMATCALLFCAG